MMREIKFRVWDKELKEMHDNIELQDITEDDLWYDGETENWWVFYDGTHEQERFVVEQFTGLHDKNGVEIYEGDILHYHYTQYDGNGTNATVIWVSSGFMLKNNNNSYLSNIKVFVGQPLKYEVIGNIHDE